MKCVFALLALMILGIGIGCASLSEYVTPATVDQKAVDYAESAGVIDADDFDGFANLEKAIRLEIAVMNAFEAKSLALEQMQEKNQLDYGILRGVVVNNLKIARQREERLFSEKGLLSMGLSLAGFGTLTGVLGLMRKRPGDITPQEMEKAVVDVKGEVTQKERQFIELVKGVQKYISTHNGEAEGLKQCLATEQSTDTKQAVALTKAVLT